MTKKLLLFIALLCAFAQGVKAQITNPFAYGDFSPVSDLGKTLSIISSMLGIGIIALPSGIITAGYMQELNRRLKEEEEAEKEKDVS